MEIIIYNARNKPAAYIDFDFETNIYLMSGKPVAYLENIGEGTSRIWGINGKHIGWFQEGLIYNAQCMKIGYTKEKCPKEFPKIKKAKQKDPILLPSFTLSDSKEDLERFLKSGL